MDLVLDQHLLYLLSIVLWLFLFGFGLLLLLFFFLLALSLVVLKQVFELLLQLLLLNLAYQKILKILWLQIHEVLSIVQNCEIVRLAGLGAHLLLELELLQLERGGLELLLLL